MIIKFISSSLGWLWLADVGNIPNNWKLWRFYHSIYNFNEIFISLFKINTIRNQSINRYVQQREKEIRKNLSMTEENGRGTPKAI